MKKITKITKLLLLFLFVFFVSIECVNAESLNWCGVYFQERERSFLMISREDVGVGSPKCNFGNFSQSINANGGIRIELEFNRGRSSFAKWKKFSGHLIEIKGKYRNGVIDGVRFIRDLGN